MNSEPLSESDPAERTGQRLPHVFQRLLHPGGVDVGHVERMHKLSVGPPAASQIPPQRGHDGRAIPDGPPGAPALGHDGAPQPTGSPLSGDTPSPHTPPPATDLSLPASP